MIYKDMDIERQPLYLCSTLAKHVYKKQKAATDFTDFMKAPPKGSVSCSRLIAGKDDDIIWRASIRACPVHMNS
jgi:hypothetical protein